MNITVYVVAVRECPPSHAFSTREKAEQYVTVMKDDRPEFDHYWEISELQIDAGDP